MSWRHLRRRHTWYIIVSVDEKFTDHETIKGRTVLQAWGERFDKEIDLDLAWCLFNVFMLKGRWQGKAHRYLDITCYIQRKCYMRECIVAGTHNLFKRFWPLGMYLLRRRQAMYGRMTKVCRYDCYAGVFAMTNIC